MEIALVVVGLVVALFALLYRDRSKIRQAELTMAITQRNLEEARRAVEATRAANAHLLESVKLVKRANQALDRRDYALLEECLHEAERERTMARLITESIPYWWCVTCQAKIAKTEPACLVCAAVRPGG